MQPEGESPDHRWRELAVRALVANPMVFFSREQQASLADPAFDIDFVDLGMDSLGRMELSIWLEREFGFDAFDVQAQEFATLNGLACFLAERMPGYAG